MKRPSPDNPASKLVRAFAETDSTEELVFYIAGTDNMLSFCQELLEQFDQDNTGPLVQEVNALCSAQAVLPGAFFDEVRKVLLALNRFHDANRNQYAVLGLEENASLEQVKQAYRSLSKRYHPDMQQDKQEGVQRFMEIAGAYHAIMAASAKPRKAPAKTSWRNHHSHRSARKKNERKRFFLVLSFIVSILIGASLFLSSLYNRSVLSRQMNTFEDQLPKGNQRFPSPAAPEDGNNSLLSGSAKPTDLEHSDQPDNPHPGSPDSGEMVSAVNIMDAEGSNIHTGLRLPFPAEPDLPAFPDKPQAKNSPDSPEVPAEIAMIAPEIPKQEEEQVVSHSQQPQQQSEKEQIPKINPSREINALIQNYSKLYSSRNLDAYLDLFSNAATENGNPVATMTDQYRSLFTHTRDINLHIENLEWNEDQAKKTFHAHGSFKVSYTYNDDKRRDYTGNIRFNLVRQRNALKIRTLDYEFN